MSKISSFLQELIRAYGRKGKRTIKIAYFLAIVLFAVTLNPNKSTIMAETSFSLLSEEMKEYSVETRVKEIHVEDTDKFSFIQEEDNEDPKGIELAVDEQEEVKEEDSVEAKAEIETDVMHIEATSKEEVLKESEDKAAMAEETANKNLDKEIKGDSKPSKGSKKFDKKADKKPKGKENKDKIEKSVSGKEIKILQRIVEAEAGGEDQKGKILVANVILNRVESSNYPDSVEEVVFQKIAGKYQFSPILDKRYWSVEVSKETKEAVQKAVEGTDYSKGALYFVARKQASQKNIRWFDNNLKWLFAHGCHEFYKDK